MENTLEMEVLELDPMAVVASKRPRPLSSIVGQLIVIDSAFIKQHLVENGDDLLRYVPAINLADKTFWHWSDVSIFDCQEQLAMQVRLRQ